jgi:hypothetical protein
VDLSLRTCRATSRHPFAQIITEFEFAIYVEIVTVVDPKRVIDLFNVVFGWALSGSSGYEACAARESLPAQRSLQNLIRRSRSRRGLRSLLAKVHARKPSPKTHEELDVQGDKLQIPYAEEGEYSPTMSKNRFDLRSINENAIMKFNVLLSGREFIGSAVPVQSGRVDPSKGIADDLTSIPDSSREQHEQSVR